MTLTKEAVLRAQVERLTEQWETAVASYESAEARNIALRADVAAQAREVERLTAELKHARNFVADRVRMHQQCEAERDALQARLDALSVTQEG
jgi:hypothetical protein